MRDRPATDEEILHILDLHDNEGLTFTEIGQRVGKSKSAIAGLAHRIKKVSEPSEHDGTMPRRWWTDRKAHT